MSKNIEYSIEDSPFNKKTERIRANLTELSASSGEEVVLARKRFYRQDEYVKLIVYDEFNITVYHKLSGTAKSILFYIIYFALDYNSPTFKLKAKVLAQVLVTDVSFIFKAINELINGSYIAKTKTRELYWINHNLFYKGRFMIDNFIKTKKN